MLGGEAQQQPSEARELPSLVPSSRLNLDNPCGACLLEFDADPENLPLRIPRTCSHNVGRRAPSNVVGLLDSCQHSFHSSCIQRWALTENCCPQCKCRFSTISCYLPDGRRIDSHKVELKDQKDKLAELDDDSDVCAICGSPGDSALLLCNGNRGRCQATYHYFCVGLDSVPSDDWFCPTCIRLGRCITADGERPPSAARARRRTRTPTPRRSTPTSQTLRGASTAIGTRSRRSRAANSAQIASRSRAANSAQIASRSRTSGSTPTASRGGAFTSTPPALRSCEATGSNHGTAPGIHPLPPSSLSCRRLVVHQPCGLDVGDIDAISGPRDAPPFRLLSSEAARQSQQSSSGNEIDDLLLSPPRRERRPLSSHMTFIPPPTKQIRLMPLRRSPSTFVASMPVPTPTLSLAAPTALSPELPFIANAAPSASEPAPVESVPVEFAPVEFAPVEFAPIQSAPVEQAPIESIPRHCIRLRVAPREGGSASSPVHQQPSLDDSSNQRRRRMKPSSELVGLVRAEIKASEFGELLRSGDAMWRSKFCKICREVSEYFTSEDQAHLCRLMSRKKIALYWREETQRLRVAKVVRTNVELELRMEGSGNDDE